MNVSKSVRAAAASALSFTLLVLPAAAQQPTKIDFSGETVGAEPKSLVAVVGIWRIESEGGKNVLAVDGRQWKEGQSSAGVADKARALYGERYAEFLDRVQAYAYYPYTVAKDVQDFRGGEITVRFEGLSGPHRSGCRHIVQSEAKWRLPDGSRELPGEQSGSLEIRKGQTVIGILGPECTSGQQAMA